MGLGYRIRDTGSESRDPGSEKNLFRIPDQGVKKAPFPWPESAALGNKAKEKWKNAKREPLGLWENAKKQKRSYSLINKPHVKSLVNIFFL